MTSAWLWEKFGRIANFAYNMCKQKQTGSRGKSLCLSAYMYTQHCWFSGGGGKSLGLVECSCQPPASAGECVSTRYSGGESSGQRRRTNDGGSRPSKQKKNLPADAPSSSSSLALSILLL